MPKPIDHVAMAGNASDAALVLKDRTLDFEALELAVGRLAKALRGHGLLPGDRVATWLPKTQIACLVPLAAARAGLVHVPINPALRRAQAIHILEDCGASLLVTVKARADLLAEMPINLLLESDAEAALDSEASMPPSSQDTQTLAAILYTSGSTGRPKGVMLSHANLWLGAVSVAHYLKISPKDRVLGVLPLSFDYGQNQLFSTWYRGGAVVPLDYLTARDVIRSVDRHAITSLAGVPPLWTQLLEADWPDSAANSVRRITNSGGALSRSMVEQLSRLFSNAAIYPMYGLTEAFRSTYLDPKLVATHPTSMGKAIPFAEIMVVRPDGLVTDEDEPGELVHCGPLVARGYWQDAERTALRFKPAPAASRYGGMAVWSGDTVRRDSEGLLHFVGRDDEMIKVAGNRISPTEIEEAAQASGAVAEAAAFGVPDERLGQAIILVARGKGEAPEERLIAFFKAELPSFMIPRQILWRAEIPRNANGKLDRVGLKAELTS